MSQKRVMIVDDDKEFLEELKETLSLNGYDVNAVSEAAKAFSEATEKDPDIILLDLKMEGMTGFEIANKLKCFPKTTQIPIIAMSGFFTENEDVTLLGFFDIRHYLQKPFSPQEVVKRIESLLKKKDN